MPFIIREVLESYNVPENVISDIEDDYVWYKRHLHSAEQEIDYLYGLLDSLNPALSVANH